MKKLFTSKPFIVSALVLTSVAIVAVCIFVSREKPPEFIPEPSQQSESTDGWEESGGTAKPSVPDGSPAAGTEQDAYPKVAEDDGENVVINFTPPQSDTPEPEPPETPKGKTEIEEPGPAHPVNEDKTVKAPEPEPEKPSGPAPGSTNGSGQVYDPAFGWVTLSPTEQITTDNDGDPNKMVGSMD